jgi:hypothetical protein
MTRSSEVTLAETTRFSRVGARRRRHNEAMRTPVDLWASDGALPTVAFSGATLMFDDSTYYTGPWLTEDMVLLAEKRLGYTLPRSYVDLLRVRNGGRPRRRCVRTAFPTLSAPDHLEVEAILGIGGRWGIDAAGPLSSPAVIEEWGYPRIGVVVCETPSAGHDTVMLDYSRALPEPEVAYIGEDRVPRVVAPTFAALLDLLAGCDRLAPTGADRANSEAGLTETPEGYTWHHDRRRGVMQLIEREIHRATGH